MPGWHRSTRPFPLSQPFAARLRFGIRSVIVPSACSAEKPIVSDSVGCGWTVSPTSSASEPISSAWTGLTETQAKAEGTPYEVAAFPWAASGRALSMGRSDGLTKLIVEPETNRILGAGIVGVNAGELLAEAVLAIEAGLDTEDVALTIHPHPTLSETVGFAAEQAEGTITDLMPKRKRAARG